MGGLLVTVAAWTCLGTFAISGLAHLLRRRQLAAALAKQRTLPHGLHRGVVAAVIALELGIGGIGIAALAGAANGSASARVALLACAGLYAFYALYGTFLLERRQAAPCGCSPGDHPVNVWVPIRAGVLAAAALSAAWAAERALPLSTPPKELALAGIASLAFGAIFWSLPAAMHDPSRDVGVHERLAEGV